MRYFFVNSWLACLKMQSSMCRLNLRPPFLSALSSSSSLLLNMLGTSLPVDRYLVNFLNLISDDVCFEYHKHLTSSWSDQWWNLDFYLLWSRTINTDHNRKLDNFYWTGSDKHSWQLWSTRFNKLIHLWPLHVKLDGLVFCSAAFQMLPMPTFVM